MTTAKEIAAQIEKAMEGFDAAPYRMATSPANLRILIGEIDRLMNVVEDFSHNIDHAKELNAQLVARAEKAEAEGIAIAASIGSNRFMDPPDGGDVSLAKQVSRMRKALEKAEAARDTNRAIYLSAMSERAEAVYTAGKYKERAEKAEAERDAYLTVAQEAQAELAQARKALEWQPIDTADKEISPVLLGIARGGTILETHVGGYAFAYNEDEVSCWWSQEADDEIVPTHWMLLPALLTDTGRTEGEQ